MSRISLRRFKMDGARRVGLAMGTVALAGTVGLVLGSAPAGATTAATATIGAGTLSVVIPVTLSFADTLNGLDQTTSAGLAIDVRDATGSGNGWNVTATSTQFTTGVYTLPTTATTVQGAPTDTCDGGATCLTATNAIGYPYTLPSGAGPPAATKVFNSAANTGMGDQTVTPPFTLAILADTYAGTYTSTWTVSAVSGP